MHPRLNRREWALFVAASAPALAQNASPAPAQPVPPASGDASNAVADLKDSSRKLADIEVPMSVEPAFHFSVIR